MSEGPSLPVLVGKAGASLRLDAVGIRASQLRILVADPDERLLMHPTETRITGTAFASDTKELAAWLEKSHPELAAARRPIDGRGKSRKVAMRLAEADGAELLHGLAELMRVNLFLGAPVQPVSLNLFHFPAEAALRSVAAELKVHQIGGWWLVLPPGEVPPAIEEQDGPRVSFRTANVAAGEAAAFVSSSFRLKETLACDDARIDWFTAKDTGPRTLLNLLERKAGAKRVQAGAIEAAACWPKPWEGTAEDLQRSTLLAVISEGEAPRALVRTAAGDLAVVRASKEVHITRNGISMGKAGANDLFLDRPSTECDLDATGLRLVATLLGPKTKIALLECSTSVKILTPEDFTGPDRHLFIGAGEVSFSLPGRRWPDRRFYNLTLKASSRQ